MSLALLFPGQGAQCPGMLQALPDTDAANAVIAESRDVCAELGLPDDLDSAARLSDTVAAQISLVIAGVASARALAADGQLGPAFVAGHSVGAYAAAVVAGVLTLHEALTVVHLRGESMRAACAGGSWGMAAVAGLTTKAAQQVVEQASTATEPVWVANINSATQTVLGGTTTALAAAEPAARRAGAAAFTHLEIAVASHGPIQDGTAQRLREHLTTLPRRTPALRYITNTGGRSVGSAEAVLDDLASAVARPVRWYDGVRLMAELGVTCTVETEPGHTLTHLVAAAAPTVTALALSDFGLRETIAKASRG
jgi:malonate decarboxylase epsilon subunit